MEEIMSRKCFVAVFLAVLMALSPLTVFAAAPSPAQRTEFQNFVRPLRDYRNLGNQKYTVESWDVFDYAVDNAQTVLHLNGVTIDQLDNAKDELEVAHSSLVSVSEVSRSVITGLAIDIRANTATIANNAIFGITNPTRVGIQYSTNPSLNGHLSTFGSVGTPVVGSVSPPFMVYLTALTPNTTYFYRAVVATPTGNHFGDIVRFTTTSVATPTPVPPNDARRSVDAAFSSAQDLERITDHTLEQSDIDRVQQMIDDAWVLVNALPGGLNKTEMENSLRLAQEWVVLAQYRLTNTRATAALRRAEEAVQWLRNNSDTFSQADIDNAERLIKEARDIADDFPVGALRKGEILEVLDALQSEVNRVWKMNLESRFVDADLKKVEGAIIHLSSNVNYFEQGDLDAARLLYDAARTAVINVSVENPRRSEFIGRLATADEQLNWLQRSLDARLARFEVDRARTEAFSRLNVDGYDTKENLDTVKRLIDQAQEQLNKLPDTNDDKVYLQGRLTDAFNRWQRATWEVENREARHLVERAQIAVNRIDEDGIIRQEDITSAQDAINLARARVDQMLDTNPNKEIWTRELNNLQLRLDELRRVASSGQAWVSIREAERVAFRLKRDGSDSPSDIEHARNVITEAIRFVQETVPDSLQPEKRNMLLLLDNLLRLQVNEAELARAARQRLTSLRNTINSFLVAQRLPSFTQLNIMYNQLNTLQADINRMDAQNPTRWIFQDELNGYRAQLDFWHWRLYSGVTTVADQSAAAAVVALINAANTTPIVPENVVAARAAYNALTLVQRSLVTNYNVLLGLESTAGFPRPYVIGLELLGTVRTVFVVNEPFPNDFAGTGMQVWARRSDGSVINVTSSATNNFAPVPMPWQGSYDVIYVDPVLGITHTYKHNIVVIATTPNLDILDFYITEITGEMTRVGGWGKQEFAAVQVMLENAVRFRNSAEISNDAAVFTTANDLFLVYFAHLSLFPPTP
jgi:hypothetical protein